jgi:hypothetical protein
MRMRSDTRGVPGWHRALALCLAGGFGCVTLAGWPVRSASG